MSHLAVGLVSVALGIWGLTSWWSIFGLVMRGVIPFALLLFGLVAILAACRRLSVSEQAAAPSRPRPGVRPSTMQPVHDEYGAEDILVS